MNKFLYKIVFVFIFFQADLKAQVGSDSTYDVVTWNIEWFGSTGNGPSNETLQLENAAQVLFSLNADVYALQEILNQTVLNNLINRLNQLEGNPNAFTGFVSNSITQDQKTAFIYRKETTTLRSIGTISTGQDSFSWAGRLPFFVEIDAQVNGTTRTITLINIHAKAFADEPSYLRRVDAARSLHTFLNTQKPADSIILLGDYNDDVDESIFNNLTTPYLDYVSDVSNFDVLTAKLSQNKESSTVAASLTEMIDHITISNELFDDYFEGSTIVIKPAITNYGNTTSDHWPVMAQFSFNVLTSIGEKISEIPSEVQLFQNFPNPFNPNTVIEFELNNPQTVSLQVFNVLGQQVAQILQGERLNAGRKQIPFDGSGLSSGLYYYRLITDAGVFTKSMTLLK